MEQSKKLAVVLQGLNHPNTQWPDG